jgi:cytochrome b561
LLPIELLDRVRSEGSMVKSAPIKYQRTAVILHWLLALLVLSLLVTGWHMVGIRTNTPARGFFFNLHKSVGIGTSGAIVALIVWRLMHSAPPLPGAMPRWERIAASVSHLLTYASLILMTLSGYVTSSFSKYGPKLFGVPLPYWGWDDAALRESFATMHRLTALVLAALIAIHIAAAMKHLIIDKDGVVQRMQPH